MRILVTGSAGHLGEGLMRRLRSQGHDALGLDVLPSPFTDRVGSITDRDFVRESFSGVQAVLHTATLHKPHVATHSRQQFLDTNLTGTLALLEAAAEAKVHAFVFTSTTSTFGHSLTPKPGEPAVWVTEELRPAPKNIYGATKVAAEDLCQLAHQDQGLPCVILKAARFFPEEDDRPEKRAEFSDENLKATEYLNRRADLCDIVDAHLLAIDRAGELGFDKFILSATTPFRREDVETLRQDAPAVVARYHPEYEEIYRDRGWSLPADLSRVYVNSRARTRLGWTPKYDFASVLESLAAGEDPSSQLAREVGAKGYHSKMFADGPYPIEPLV